MASMANMSRRYGINILHIITKFKRGDTRYLDVLVAELSKPELEDKVLLDILRKSRDCVSLIDKDCEFFIGALLALDWTSKDARLIIEYQAFILNLISAHMCYLKPCVRMMVTKFIPVMKPGVYEISAENIITDSQKFVNVHSLLKSVALLVPMVSKVLVSLIADLFPYLTKHAYVHEFYVRNILQICQYLPDQRRDILSILVSKLLELDSRASRVDILDTLDGESDEDSADDDDAEEIFQMESDEASCNEQTNNVQKPMSHAEANKLDICMGLLLDYIYNICYLNGELEWESTKILYKHLLTVFDAIILSTFSCAHVQFIMFYICSFKLPLSEGFIDYLWKKVRDINTQPLFRQAAVAYLSSFLARAKYIPISTVVTTLEVMCGWIHAYHRQSSYSSLQADVTHHGPFYSVCQAVFYVFIFRHKEILELRKGHNICIRLNFASMVTNPLNPLKICLPMIATTFSSITRMHQLAYCDAIVERNNRSILPVTSFRCGGSSGRFTQTNLLDSFFPFDPYLLTRSRKFFEPLYLEFTGSNSSQDENDASEEEDAFAEDKGYSSHMTSNKPIKSPQVTSSPDFFNYATSPGFKNT